MASIGNTGCNLLGLALNRSLDSIEIGGKLIDQISCFLNLLTG